MLFQYQKGAIKTNACDKAKLPHNSLYFNTKKVRLKPLSFKEQNQLLEDIISDSGDNVKSRKSSPIGSP